MKSAAARLLGGSLPESVPGGGLAGLGGKGNGGFRRLEARLVLEAYSGSGQEAGSGSLSEQLRVQCRRAPQRRICRVFLLIEFFSRLLLLDFIWFDIGDRGSLLL